MRRLSWEGLLARDGRVLTITAVKARPVGVTVYNFEVAGDHDYYVSTAQLLVHNCDGISGSSGGDAAGAGEAGAANDAAASAAGRAGESTGADAGSGAAAQGARSSAVSEGKTTATVAGKRTLSGWASPTPEGFTRVSPQKVLEFQKQIGHPIRRAGAADMGVPGQYFASHAERQAALLEPNAPIEVSSPLCSDCQAFFQRVAEYSGVEQRVTDPLGTHSFSPF